MSSDHRAADSTRIPKREAELGSRLAVLESQVVDLRADVAKLEAREHSQPIHVGGGTGPHPPASDESKARTGLWVALTAFVSAAIGWLSGQFR